MNDEPGAGADQDERTPRIEVVSSVPTPSMPPDSEVMTLVVTLPPGSPGSPPHRHPGPAFGYLIEGEMRFEVEGEPERIVRAGETFWEPGGDLIHYQDANNLPDAPTVFVAHLVVPRGEEPLTVVDAEELEARKGRRAPR